MIDMHDTAIARLVEGLVGPAAAQETLARIAHLPDPPERPPEWHRGWTSPGP
jgi:hypothetical protein